MRPPAERQTDLLTRFCFICHCPRCRVAPAGAADRRLAAVGGCCASAAGSCRGRLVQEALPALEPGGVASSGNGGGGSSGDTTHVFRCDECGERLASSALARSLERIGDGVAAGVTALLSADDGSGGGPAEAFRQLEDVIVEALPCEKLPIDCFLDDRPRRSGCISGSKRRLAALGDNDSDVAVLSHDPRLGSAGYHGEQSAATASRETHSDKLSGDGMVVATVVRALHELHATCLEAYAAAACAARCCVLATGGRSGPQLGAAVVYAAALVLAADALMREGEAGAAPLAGRYWLDLGDALALLGSEATALQLAVTPAAALVGVRLVQDAAAQNPGYVAAVIDLLVNLVEMAAPPSTDDSINAGCCSAGAAVALASQANAATAGCYLRALELITLCHGPQHAATVLARDRLRSSRALGAPAAGG
eukprot:SM000009S23644  [mRNA]  locus=s9:1321528:1323043:- [translate_table: standard]